ncbi:sugar phosphate isomerase/epimerase [Jeotgalibacillus sp. S-D1]|uniref:sugar phosphate isomerase/epimerase family protein n=1 Tax=Jeotgalibacillus sp. S-D1 TaxID=2552189 RepID=UPI00105A4CA3|nr:sugar phosphate isomerase/epimerase [Jeotgalibacillus sp. S-D1]TDL34263.1 sugar phosphate isomerase/epimerase [Jeotgalibacillus sp. S-D1]
MSIGVLAHLFGKQPYEKLAAEIGQAGFDHVQLALWKAVESPDFNEAGKLSPGLARKIKDAFSKNGVSISVLACYLHLFERDEMKRKNHLERFKELLRYAPSFGTRVVAVEVGKMPAGFTQEDWTTLRASIHELLLEAEKWGVIIGIEPANDHLIGDAKTLHEFLFEFPATNLGVVLDPGNLLTADNLHNQDAVIQEAFELLGDRIVACHAKDRIMINNEIQTASPGRGKMNYDLYFQLLNKMKPGVDIIMEAANTPEERKQSKRFLDEMIFNA